MNDKTDKAKKTAPEVIAACRALEADPACEHETIDEKALLDCAVYADKVVVVIATGQKYTVSYERVAEWLKKVTGGDKKGDDGPTTTRKQ